MRKRLLFFALLLISFAWLSAQALRDYVTATSTDGTFTDMTGATNGSTTSYSDEGYWSTPVNIGFNFVFGGTTYTQFFATANGQMGLGSTAWGANLSPAASRAIIAPCGGDNSINDTSAGVDTYIRYKLTGSSPNQILTVEWTNFRVPYGTANGDYSQMQVRLYESNNKVEMVYGTFKNSGTSATSRSIFISQGNLAANIVSVNTSTLSFVLDTTTTYSNSWAASSVITNLNSPTDGSRRVFSFTPPSYYPAYNPTPATTATGQDVRGNLTWTQSPATTLYTVLMGTTNPPTTSVVTNAATSGSTGSYTYSGLTASTVYYWQVATNNGSTTTTSPVWSFTTGAGAAVAPTTPSPATAATGVAYSPIPTLTWTWGVFNNTYVLYMDTNSTPTTQVASGNGGLSGTTGSYTPTSLNAGTKYYWKLVVTGSNATAVTGTTWNFTTLGVPTTPTSPSPATAAVMVSNTPTLSWTWGDYNTTYQLYMDTSSSPTTVVASGNGGASGTTGSYTPGTALTGGTKYYWKLVVTGPGGAGSVTTTSSVWNFTTVPPTVTSFPFIEGFNSSSIPTYWGTKILAVATSSLWSFTSSGSYPTCTPAEGTYMAHFNSYTGAAGSQEVLYTPPLLLPAGAYLTFQEYHYNQGNDALEGINVMISTDGINWTTTLGAFPRYAATTGWATHGVDLSSYAGQTVYVGFCGISQWDYYCNMDDVHVYQNLTPPGNTTLLAPNALTDQISSVSLSWNAASGATGYNLYVGTNNPPTNYINGTAVGNVTSYNVTGLSLNSTYYWTVVPTNAGGNGAVTNGPFSFSTITGISTFPNTENFDGVTAPALPTGWTAVAPGWSASVVSATNTTAPSQLNCINITNSSLSGGTDQSMLISRPYVFSSANRMKASFSYKTSTTDVSTVYSIGYITNPLVPSTFVSLGTVASTSTWTNTFAVLPEGISGTCYLAVRNPVGASYVMYIDNVTLSVMPTTPVYTFTNPGTDYGTVTMPLSSAAKTYSISNDGVGTISITGVSVTGTNNADFVLSGWAGTTVDLGTAASTSFSVTFTPIANGNRTATLHVVASTGTYDYTLTGVGYNPICTIPYSQNFDAVTASALPNDWFKIISGSSTVSTSTSTYISSPNAANLYRSSTSDNCALVTPPANLSSSAGALRARFYAAGGTSGNTLLVGYVTSPTSLTSFVQAGSITLTTTMTMYTVDLPLTDGTRYIAFQAGSTTYSNTYVDNVTWEVTPAAPVFDITQTNHAYGDLYVGAAAVSTNFIITNIGGGTLNITNCQINGDSSFSIASGWSGTAIPLAANSSTTLTVAALPTTPGNKTANLVITDDVSRTVHTYTLTCNGLRGDNIASPLIVTLVNGAAAYTGSTTNATNDYTFRPGTTDTNTAPDVVYSITLTRPTVLTIDLSGSAFDTYLSIYSSTVTPGASNYIAYDDDGGDSTTSLISDCAVAAGTYYIIIDGYSSGAGAYVMNITSSDFTAATDLVCTPNGTDIDLTWTEVTGANSYKIYAASTADGTFTLIGASDVNSYTDTDAITSNAMRFYKVIADSAMLARGTHSTQNNMQQSKTAK